MALVIAVPWLLALSPAMLGGQNHPLVGLPPLLVAFAGNSYDDRDFLKMPGPVRRKVIAVQRSGQTSGDPTLDQIALERLRHAARSARSERILLPILLTIYLATPIVAAIRTDNGWWLLVPSRCGGCSGTPDSLATRRPASSSTGSCEPVRSEITTPLVSWRRNPTFSG